MIECRLISPDESTAVISSNIFSINSRVNQWTQIQIIIKFIGRWRVIGVWALPYLATSYLTSTSMSTGMNNPLRQTECKHHLSLLSVVARPRCSQWAPLRTLWYKIRTIVIQQVFKTNQINKPILCVSTHTIIKCSPLKQNTVGVSLQALTIHSLWLWYPVVTKTRIKTLTMNIPMNFSWQALLTI